MKTSWFNYFSGETNPKRQIFAHQSSILSIFKSLEGWEIVDSASRLCAMNLYLHGIEGRQISDGKQESPVNVEDSLGGDPGKRFDMVLTNPPFGKKSSITIIGEDGKQSKDDSLSYERNDFWTTTSNKQLNFVQHIKTILNPDGGSAAVVVPDNVLFEGGAGETIRAKLLQTSDVHTLLRLPTGIFYAQGVKANVLFFDSRPASPDAQTKQLWIYDLRTNQHFTLKTNPLTYADLEDFITCYNPGNRHRREETERFKVFDYETLIKRDKVSLDIFWLKDDSLEDLENLPRPEIIAREIAENLQVAFSQFDGIYAELGESE
ncbi:MAG: N-6 DNA methylase [bacterium]|nr:N-6 DNA methylase [bacterium]